MKNDLQPDRCLRFESDTVQRLDWMPLAVRFKLDVARLRLTLQQWQALPHAQRLDLVQCLSTEEFARKAVAAGAYLSSGETKHGNVDPARASLMLRVDVHTARDWWAEASPFARYVLGKQVAKKAGPLVAHPCRQESPVDTSFRIAIL